MPGANRCRCGKMLKYEGEPHQCLDAKSDKVELNPAQYCQQFGHAFSEIPIPGTSRTVTEYGSKYSEYEVDNVFELSEVTRICTRCGLQTQGTKKICTETRIDGKKL